MGSSIFDMMHPNQTPAVQQPPENNMNDMLAKFNQFKQSFPVGQNPEQIVKNMIANKVMSSDQFKQIAQMANTLYGVMR